LNKSERNTSTDFRNDRIFKRALEISGPCVRLERAIAEFFRRVFIIYHRKLDMDDNPLKTSILSSMNRWNYPRYKVQRSNSVFKTRENLVECVSAYDTFIRIKNCLVGKTTKEKGDIEDALSLYRDHILLWKAALQHCSQTIPENYYLLRFHSGTSSISHLPIIPSFNVLRLLFDKNHGVRYLYFLEKILHISKSF
jgi:hypothetical protein